MNRGLPISRDGAIERMLAIQYWVGIVRKVLAVAERHLMGTITHVETQEEVAALTFDDRPHPEYTPCLLEILERHEARATFFMVGEAAIGTQRSCIGSHRPGTRLATIPGITRLFHQSPVASGESRSVPAIEPSLRTDSISFGLRMVSRACHRDVFVSRKKRWE